MTKKNISTVRSLSKDELHAKIRETESEIFHSRLKVRTGQLANVSSIWKARKNLARMKTVLTELERTGK